MNGSINEITKTTIDYPCWVERSKNTALFFIHTIFRLLQPYKQLKQDDPFHSASSWEKSRLPNSRLIWAGKSRPALYRYSY